MPQAQTSHSALAAIHESSISAKTARDRKAATCAGSPRQRRTGSEISVDGPKGLREQKQNRPDKADSERVKHIRIHVPCKCRKTPERHAGCFYFLRLSRDP